MSADYSNCTIVVTGRPNDRFASWSAFKTYSCRPFSFDQFSELIEKVPFDDKSKKKFQKVATAAFFEKHQDFLSNPLLAQMMLMTYRDNAEIPNKLAIFYENCYLTLFLRHDALKEQMRRPKLLDQDEFRRLFSVFCFFSYLKSKPDFTEMEIRTFIEKSIERCKYPVTVDQVLEEFLETVNLIQKDGTKYQFIHRSFQEYFAAHCAVRVLAEKSRKVLTFFAERATDKTFELAFELHPDLVVSEYFIPEYTDLCDEDLLGNTGTERTAFQELQKSSFEISHGVFKGGRLSFHSGWTDHQRCTTFAQTLSRTLGLTDYTQVISEHLLGMHNRLPEISNAIQSSPIAKNTTIFINVMSDGDGIIVEASSDREYKRPPKILNDLQKFVLEISTVEFEAVGTALIERREMVDASMKRMIGQSTENSTDLASEFGI